MIENVIIEAVRSKQISAVIDGVDGPVLSQLLGTQHKDTIVAQLVVLDNRQCLKCLSQTNTVRNDASIVFFDLVDCAKDTITLKAVQLLPDKRVLDARSLFDDVVFA